MTTTQNTQDTAPLTTVPTVLQSIVKKIDTYLVKYDEKLAKVASEGLHGLIPMAVAFYPEYVTFANKNVGVDGKPMVSKQGNIV